MIMTRIWLTKETYQTLIKNTIARVMKEKGISEDTAVLWLSNSYLFKQFIFVIN